MGSCPGGYNGGGVGGTAEHQIRRAVEVHLTLESHLWAK